MRNRKMVDLDKLLEEEDGLQEVKWAVCDMKEVKDFLEMDVDNLNAHIKSAESLITEIEQDKSHFYHSYQRMQFGGK